MFPRTMKREKCAIVSYGISSCHAEAVTLLTRTESYCE